MVLRKRINKGRVALLGVVFLCSMVYARDPFAAIVFQPSKTILGNLFGSVDNVLPGNDGLMALLFRIFNVSILIFGSTFAALTIMQTVIQTAASGIFMGKKGSQSGYFTLFRTLGGLILVAPKASGYCAIQIFVMMIVTKSITLAGNLSHEILFQSMRTPTDVLFSALPNMPPTLGVTALNASKLSNNHVQDFYRKVVKNSVCAVEYNRRQPVPFRSPAQLYSVENGKIRFPGCRELSLSFTSLAGSINPTAYQQTIEAGISQLINPVMTSIFYNLPPTRPTANASTCFTTSCSTSTVAQVPNWLMGIKDTIEIGHDSMASNFVLSIPPTTSTTSSSGGVSQDFLYNWLEFPVMYQAVMDVKGNGLSSTSLTQAGGLLELATGPSNRLGGTRYTDLASIVTSLEGTTTGDTALDAMIGNIVQLSAQGASTSSSLFLPPVTTLTVPTGFGSTTTSIIGSITPAHADRMILIQKMESLLSKLMYGNYPRGNVATGEYIPSSGAKPYTMAHIWEHQNFAHFDEGEATFTNAFQRLQTRSGTERALRDPVDSLVYYTGDKWMETYLYKNSEIILSPARKLGEVAAYISGQSTFFMFTVMRNVMADQVMRSFNVFWTFFGTKMATGLAKATTTYLQEQMWDWMHCLTIVPQPVVGTSGARHPACNPMILFLIVPILNPGWAAEMGFSAGFIGGMTAANITTHVLDATLTGLFNYVFLLSAQYDYAYNGYIVMATMPVMVISNLLAIWIPMMPSLVYFISIIGWIFAVVEAIIAAPLVVMGMTFPQGHDFLGSSQQALILILSVFLRAPLIVIGFFIGMIILSVAMYALSEGLVPLGIGMFITGQTANPSLGDGFLLYAFMVIVLYITGLLLMQAVSLTYKLPNKILLWVGGQPTDSIEEETAQAIQGLVNQQQGSVLQSVGQAAVSVKSASEGVSSQAGGGFKAGRSIS